MAVAKLGWDTASYRDVENDNMAWLSCGAGVAAQLWSNNIGLVTAQLQHSHYTW